MEEPTTSPRRGPSQWVRNHAWLSVVMALFVGLVVGGVAVGSELEEAKDEIADLEQTVEITKANFGKATSTAMNLEQELMDLEQEVEEKEKEIAKARAVLEKKVAAIKARERKVSKEERRIEASTFGDGIWQVGKDIQPGLYRAPGGSTCYWAELNSADRFDISGNGGFGPNQTVQIDTAWFESSDCGEWKKIS